MKSKNGSKTATGKNRNDSFSLLGLNMEQLIDDEVDQIIGSKELLYAFLKSTESRKNYSKNTIKDLFDYVVVLYNDTIENDEKYGALTYLQKISNCLDYLTIDNLMKLNLKQLNYLIDLEDINSLVRIYNIIINSKPQISREDYPSFHRLFSKRKYFDKSKSKELFEYLSELYNTSTSLQDSITRNEFFVGLSKKLDYVKHEYLLSLRIVQILDLFDISSDGIVSSSGGFIDCINEHFNNNEESDYSTM